MKLLMPTLGRVGKWPTLRWAPNVTMVVQAHEAPKYGDRDVLVLPDDIRTIAPTRQWILDNFSGKVFVLDDDLDFLVRRTDDPTKFRQPQPGDVEEMLAAVEQELDLRPHVGLASREGGNRQTEEKIYATRLLGVHAYNLDVINQVGAKFRLPVMEDFDFALQLLRAGYADVKLNRWAEGARKSNASGGCSVYRTPELQTKAAHMLKELHPDFVTIVEKETKHAWGGGKRTDVRIQWRKAFLSSGKKLPTL